MEVGVVKKNIVFMVNLMVEDEVWNGIYVFIGLVFVEGFEVVWVICMVCYLVKLVI